MKVFKTIGVNFTPHRGSGGSEGVLTELNTFEQPDYSTD